MYKTRRARDFKFGTQMQSGNISKTAKKNPEKDRGLGHVTPINFGVHPNLSPKQDELDSWNLINRCVVTKSQKPAKKNLEKGRGLGHVTTVNFGVHPNVPPKRVELETWNLAHRCVGAKSQKPAKKNPEKGRGLGHGTPKNFGVHPNVSPKRLETELKFGTQMHRGHISKSRKDQSRKGAWPRSRDHHKTYLKNL